MTFQIEEFHSATHQIFVLFMESLKIRAQFHLKSLRFYTFAPSKKPYLYARRNYYTKHSNRNRLVRRF
jgi:hypothetical protein